MSSLLIKAAMEKITPEELGTADGMLAGSPMNISPLKSRVS